MGQYLKKCASLQASRVSKNLLEGKRNYEAQLESFRKKSRKLIEGYEPMTFTSGRAHSNPCATTTDLLRSK